MAAKTVRDLVSGTGTVTVVNGSRRLTFQFNQILKPGTSIQTNLTGTPISFTIQSGALNEWVADQPSNMSGSSMPFNRTDTTTSKARGASGVLVPDATHYVYQSNTADDGNPDCYIYVDTLAPESGIHPYTHDHVVSSFRTAKTVSQAIPDLSMRVRRLEGVLRAGRPGSSLSNDFRLADAVARMWAIERNVNGQAGVPAVGSNATYTEQQFIDAGDPA